MIRRFLAMLIAGSMLLTMNYVHIYAAEGDLASVIAEVGDTEYASLTEAIAAAGAGDTVVVIDDIELSETVAISKDKVVTIDLNGNTITGTPDVAAAYAVITNYGNLTITDSSDGAAGMIFCNHTLAGSTAYAVNTITNSGTLTIENGTIKNTSTSTNQIGYAIDNNSTSNDAILTINGGTITVSGSYYYDGIRQFCNSLTKENSVTVTGGTVSSLWTQNPSDGNGDRNTEDVKGSVNISGGTVTSFYLEPGTGFDISVSAGEVGSIEFFDNADENDADRQVSGFVTGGTFTSDVSEFVADGYQISDNGDGTFGIVRDHGIFGTSFYAINIPTETEGYYRVLFFAGIDSLNYTEVGFKFYNNDKYVTSTSTNSVYKKITANNTSVSVDDLGVFRIYGAGVLFPESYDDVTTLTYQPYAIDLEGAEILGATYNIEDIHTN